MPYFAGRHTCLPLFVYFFVPKHIAAEAHNSAAPTHIHTAISMSPFVKSQVVDLTFKPLTQLYDI